MPATNSPKMDRLTPAEYLANYRNAAIKSEYFQGRVRKVPEEGVIHRVIAINLADALRQRMPANSRVFGQDGGEPDE